MLILINLILFTFNNDRYSHSMEELLCCLFIEMFLLIYNLIIRFNIVL